MRYQGATLVCAALFVSFGRPMLAQELGKNAPHYVKSVKTSGLDVRYLDFQWDEEAFNTLEKGGPHPVGRRSWVLARFLTTLNPFRCEGRIMPVGPSLLILNPARPGAGPTLEVRYIDLREVFADMNVIAEPPAGETYCLKAAVFRKVDKKAERLELTLIEGKGSFDVVTHYGDRETRMTLVRD